MIRKGSLKGPTSLDEVPASLINPLSGGNDNLPATLNPAQVDIGYSQEFSEYLYKQDQNKQDQRKQNKGEK